MSRKGSAFQRPSSPKPSTARTRRSAAAQTSPRPWKVSVTDGFLWINCAHSRMRLRNGRRDMDARPANGEAGWPLLGMGHSSWLKIKMGSVPIQKTLLCRLLARQQDNHLAMVLNWLAGAPMISPRRAFLIRVGKKRRPISHQSSKNDPLRELKGGLRRRQDRHEADRQVPKGVGNVASGSPRRCHAGL